MDWISGSRLLIVLAVVLVLVSQRTSAIPSPQKESWIKKLTTPRSWDVCPHTEPRLAGADLWPIFFPSDLPNLYTSVPNWAWSSCDSTLSNTDCQKIGFTDSGDKFYKPGDLPSNGTSTLHNVAGTVTAPPSGTVLTWSQSSTSWTVTATGYDRKAVSSQSEYRATATGTDVFQTQTGTNVANGYAATPVAAMLAGVGVVGAFMI